VATRMLRVMSEMLQQPKEYVDHTPWQLERQQLSGVAIRHQMTYESLWHQIGLVVQREGQTYQCA
jgi:hypothetical protein